MDKTAFPLVAKCENGTLELSDNLKHNHDRSIGYVYAIDIDGQLYVGSTWNLRERIQQHYSFLKLGKSLPKVQAAYDKVQSFSVYLIMRINEGDKCETLTAEHLVVSLLTPELNSSKPRGAHIDINNYFWQVL